MTSDPNADLIGYTFTDGDGRSLTVLGTTRWSTQYVDVASEGYCTVRAAKLVRMHRQHFDH